MIKGGINLNYYKSRRFWVAASERSIASFAQGILTILTAGALSIFEIDAFQLFSVGALYAATSIATSVAYPKRIMKPDADQAQVEEIVRKIVLENYGEVITVIYDEKRTSSDINTNQ